MINGPNLNVKENMMELGSEGVKGKKGSGQAHLPAVNQIYLLFMMPAFDLTLPFGGFTLILKEPVIKQICHMLLHSVF